MIYTYRKPTNHQPPTFSSAVGQHVDSSSMEILSRLSLSLDTTRSDIVSRRYFTNREFMSKWNGYLTHSLHQSGQSHSGYLRRWDQNYFPHHSTTGFNYFRKTDQNYFPHHSTTGPNYFRKRDQNYFSHHSIASPVGFKRRDQNYFPHRTVATVSGSYGCGAGYGRNSEVNDCQQQPTGL